ncbi:MAG: LLM class flavin-dependent oxidoreductase [Actinomycetota bacterium]|nr:LLM class flavin-dependent oxidoreductase [Actinomycetota bacterium]
MRPTFGVLTPVTRNMYALEEQATLEAAVRDGLIDALWVRDLPCAPEGDPDVGQGHDPFAHLAFLAGRGSLSAMAGVASVVMGTRHPLVVARAAVGAQVHSGGGFVLGLGSGGKPPVSAALGVGDRSLKQFIREWSAIWRALRGGSPDGSTFALPHEYRPPPMWLASGDADKWAAVGETATGWLTFFASPRTLLEAYEDAVAARGDAPAVGVRLDLRLVPVSDQPTVVAPPVRGVVTCSVRQLGGVFRPMRNLPVDHLLLNLVGDHAGGLRHVHEIWHGRFG